MRRALPVLLLTVSVAWPLAGADARARGDLNGDGVVDPLDLALLRRAFARQIPLDPMAHAAADVAPVRPGQPPGDGVVGFGDLVALGQGLLDADLDGDGLSASFENLAGTSIFDGTTDGITPDSLLDLDGDGLNHGDEFSAGTDPRASDTDRDGLDDDFEFRFGFDPTRDEQLVHADSDGDRLSNRIEQILGSDPRRADSDHDGRPDAGDVACPLDPDNDIDGDGVCHERDVCPFDSDPGQSDADGDGVGDACDLCPDVAGNDPDRDGICGAADNCPAWPNPAQRDGDADGRGDACECGDVTDDGVADGADALVLADRLANGHPALPAPHKCDLDGDGLCTADDLAALQQSLASGAARGEECADTGILHRGLLARTGYGPDPWSLERIAQRGVASYLDEQLDPDLLSDPEVALRLLPFEEGEFQTWNRPLSWLRESYCRHFECMMRLDFVSRIRLNLQKIKMLHAIHSRRQLEVLLLDFWFNHFNVNGASQTLARWAVQSYEQQALRPRVLGTFEDLLLAMTRSPAMLDFLDLRQNVAGSTNENFARELLELHTVGREQSYDELDVREIARILTGYGWRGEPEFAFEFDPGAHDDGVKTVTLEGTPAWVFDGALGCGERGPEAFEDEGQVLLCLLARHPGTARRISEKLIHRFVTETPDPAFVERVAQQWIATGGALRPVVESILTSPELAEAVYFGEKVKRPHVYAASLMRALAPDEAGVHPSDDRYAFDAMVYDLTLLGEPLFTQPSPRGYSEASSAWVGTGSAITRANLAERTLRALPDSAAHFGVEPDTPAAEFVGALGARLAGGLSHRDGDRIAAFADELPIDSVHPTRERVRQAAAVILSSPRFLRY